MAALLPAAAGPAAAPKSPEPRRIALRLTETLQRTPDLDRFAEAAKRRGIELQSAAEGVPVPKQWETAHFWVAPVSEGGKSALARFPISVEDRGFAFDGRQYSGEADAIALTDPGRPAETFLLGGSARAVLALAARRLLYGGGAPPNYEVVSGELTKEGVFVASGGRLAIDRASDRDAVAAREAFFKDLQREKQGAVEWEVREIDRAGADRWKKTAALLAGKRGFSVRVFPDATTKALYTGSSRPADLSPAADRQGVRVDLDVSAPDEPDLVSPVLAAAALASAEPALAGRRTLLLAAGARRIGTWWGRDVRGFAAFTRAAGVEPSIGDVLESADDVSPILAVGAAAAWLDAGARLDSAASVEKALAGPAASLSEKLSRWREAALRQTVKPPARRALPEGFLRGVSYAMTNSIEGGYAAPRSRQTLETLRSLSVNSISVMPFAFARDAASDSVHFVHRSPQGETDEGILRAVRDAHGLGMSAMVKPQIWLGEGGFVGDIAMADDRAWKTWFDSYRRFVVHQAIVAEAAGAALFCVGTELKATETRQKQWRDTIAAVRLATGAPLLYAAHWAVDAPAVVFWDALDAIGVDFYDPLGKPEKLSDAVLEEGARRAARPVADLSRRTGKPVVFTEAGFPPVRAAWSAPHEEESSRLPAPEDAARATAAVYRALGRESWWKGVYWWKVFSDGRPAAPGDRGFNFLGMPAARAITEGFSKPLGPESGP